MKKCTHKNKANNIIKGNDENYEYLGLIGYLPNIAHIVAKNTIIETWCADCGKKIKTVDCGDFVKKIPIK